MRISHSDLDACRRNPKQWVAAKLFGTGGGFSYGYNQALKGAIYTYHRVGDPGKGNKYLAEKLSGFKDEARKSECKRALKNYIAWAESSERVVASCKVRLNLLLHGGVLLGGEISRVDIDSGSDNYEAIILGELPNDWQNELRFPLIQYEIATQFQRPASMVRIGFQSLDGANLVTTKYSRAAVEEALAEARQLGKIVHGEIVKQTGDL